MMMSDFGEDYVFVSATDARDHSNCRAVTTRNDCNALDQDPPLGRAGALQRARALANTLARQLARWHAFALEEAQEVRADISELFIELSTPSVRRRAYLFGD